jgi:hypothetical protein
MDTVVSLHLFFVIFWALRLAAFTIRVVRNYLS